MLFGRASADRTFRLPDYQTIPRNTGPSISTISRLTYMQFPTEPPSSRVPKEEVMTLRFMMLCKPDDEIDRPPTPPEIEVVGQLIGNMAKAGALIATDGL